MDVSVKVKDSNLESSGSVYLESGANEFSISVDDVEITFEFKGIDNLPVVHARTVNDKNATMVLENWNNPNGTSNLFKDVIIIGDRFVSIGLAIFSIGSGIEFARLAHFSVYSNGRASA